MGWGGFEGRINDAIDERVSNRRGSHFVIISERPYSNFTKRDVSEYKYTEVKKSIINYTDEELFLGESCYLLEVLNTDSLFRSKITRGYFKNVMEQVSEVVSSLPDKDLTKRFSKNAKEYLFDAFSGYVYSQMLFKSLPKIEFWEIVEDTIYLMKKWKIVDVKQDTYHNIQFFEWFSKKYSIKKEEFFVCPHCGGEILKGVKNCPNCYEIIRDEQLKIKHELEYDSINKKFISDNIKQENILLELQNKNQMAKSEIEKYKNEIEALKQIIVEKDIAIKAYREHIAGVGNNKSDNERVLIIGDSRIDKDIIRNLLVEFDINLEKVDIMIDYNKVKNYAEKVINSNSYCAVIVGPTPHKTKLSNKNSFIDTLKSKNMYVIEAKNYQGTLEINKETLYKSLETLTLGMLSKGVLLQ